MVRKIEDFVFFAFWLFIAMKTDAKLTLHHMGKFFVSYVEIFY